jgi:uncharacterized SAM-binding protein YcdF (DUF218 family)
MHPTLRAAMVCLALPPLIAAGDFAVFVVRAAEVVNAPRPVSADAVVALTGGSDARIASGLELAADLQVPLLISGVYANTTPADIVRIWGAAADQVACCVTLGKVASTTEGNGDEAALWARANGYRRLVVVTSDYHMDRAMTEIRRAMPEATLLPHAVASDGVASGGWLAMTDMRRRLIEEWGKLRVAQIRALRQTVTEGRVKETP